MLSHGQDFDVKHLSTYATGIFDEGAAEIVAYDPGSKKLFFVNGGEKAVAILDVSDPETPVLVGQIGIAGLGGGVNSVAVKNGIVAIAIEAEVKQDNGVVAFYDTDGNFLSLAETGALPDMLLFNEAGNKLIVANEGEPSDDYTVDPLGSVTIVDAPFEQASSTLQVDFSSYNPKKASLINKGVRIFGPNASVAQDLEPEYISITDSLLHVVCQENNAMVVINMNTGELLDIMALPLKDHLRGKPSLSTIDLQHHVPVLGSPIYAPGRPVKVSGFSGLYYAADESDQNIDVYYTVPDRGPNDAPVAKASVGTSQNLRPFKLPDYQGRIVKFSVDRTTSEVTLLEGDQIMLTSKDGVTPISGKGNVSGFDEVPVTPMDGEVYTTSDYEADGIIYSALEYDPYGGDFEGIVRDNDGNWWLCDEYRPSVYKFDAAGVLIERYVPAGTSLLGDTPQEAGYYGAETLPVVYNKRWANRGFEGIAYDPDQDMIYAFIQSALDNPDNSSRHSDVIRILGIRASDGIPMEEYVYGFERNRDSGFTTGRVDKIGDAVYIGNGRFNVLERDSGLPGNSSSKKMLFEVDLRGATNILGMELATKATSSGLDDKTLEMMTLDEIVAAGIQPVHKRKVLNLPSIGYLPSDKAEGLVLTNDGRLVVLNDNDFGLNGAGVTDEVSLGVITFQGDAGMDASDKDESINILPQQVLGMIMPDAITNAEIEGRPYILTANEGDSRDYVGFSEELRVEDLMLNPSYFSDSTEFVNENNLGRLKTTITEGDLDGDLINESIYSYGGRSFSIFDIYGNLVYDSGDEFERKIAELAPESFNSGNDDNDSFDNRSDDKGPEPEAITIAKLDGRQYALVGLERQGGVMVYDITSLSDVKFVTYFNNRDFGMPAEESLAGDLGVEDIKFIEASESPNGVHLIVTANEISGTISVFSVNAGVTPTVKYEIDEKLSFPNPATTHLAFSRRGNFMLTNLWGQAVLHAKDRSSMDLSGLSPGLYVLTDIDNGRAQKIIKQ